MDKNNSNGQTSIKDFFKSTKKYLKKSEEIKTNSPTGSVLLEKGSKRKLDDYLENSKNDQIQNENYTKTNVISRDFSCSDIESINSDQISIYLPDNLIPNEDKIKNRFEKNISKYNFVPFSNTLNSNLSIHFTSNCSSNGSDYSKLFDEDFETVDNNEYSKLICTDHEHCEHFAECNKLNKSKVIDKEPFTQSVLETLLCNSRAEEENTSPCPCNRNSCKSYPCFESEESYSFVERYLDSISGISDDDLLKISPTKYSDGVGFDIQSNELSLNDSNRLELGEDILSQQELANSLLSQDFKLSQFADEASNNSSFELTKKSFPERQDVTNIEKVLENSFEIDTVENYTSSNVPIDAIKNLNEEIDEILNSNLKLKSISDNCDDGLIEVIRGESCEYIPDLILPSKSTFDEEKQLELFAEYDNILYNDLFTEETDDVTEELSEDLKMITNFLCKVEEFYLSNITTLEEFDLRAKQQNIETLNYKHFLKDLKKSSSPTEEKDVISSSCMKFLSSEHLLYIGDPETEISLKARHKLVIVNLQRELNRLFADAAQNKQLYFKYKNTRDWDNVIIANNILVQKNDDEAKFTLVKKYSKQSAAKFNTMFQIIQRIFYLISRNERITKRELFYEFNEIKRGPSVIYDALNSVACMLQVPLWYCNIYSTSKGLVYGDLIITIDGQEINFNRSGGTLVPTDTLSITRIVSKAMFILIVEKDTIFQKLLDEDIPNKLTQPFLLVTGKGYADMTTQIFLKKIWMHCKIPAFILVDADPNGIEIMLTYKFGSLNLAHCSSHLALPQLRWIGVFPSEIRHLNINFKPLTDRDVKNVGHLLRRPYIKLNKMIEAELQELLNSNIKAEIEGLIQRDKYLSETYIPDKLCSMNF